MKLQGPVEDLPFRTFHNGGTSWQSRKDFREMTARNKRKSRKYVIGCLFSEVAINPENVLFYSAIEHPQTFFPVDFLIGGFAGHSQSTVCACVCVHVSIITLVQLKIKWGQQSPQGS